MAVFFYLNLKEKTHLLLNEILYENLFQSNVCGGCKREIKMLSVDSGSSPLRTPEGARSSFNFFPALELELVISFH